MLAFLTIVSIILLSSSVYLFLKNKKQARLLAIQSEKHQELVLTQTEKHELQKNLANVEGRLKQAIEDPVTHLIGWQLFEDRIKQSIQESNRYQFIMGLLIVDIDDFNMINEALSHEGSDLLLADVAKRLRACIREVDSVSRFGKDRFGVLLTQLAKPETAAIVAQRILEAISRPFLIYQREIYITAGVGISIYPDDSQDTSMLIRHAEDALLVAKNKQKHVYQFYQEKINVNSKRELALHSSLRQEFIFNELVLSYFPIVNINENRICAMDVMVNWHHPELGLVNTDELFSYAEKHRKLNLISEWVVKHACQQYIRWKSFDFQPDYLGIPIAIKQLDNSPFIYRLSQIFQETGFDPKKLLLEMKADMSNISFDIIEKSLNMLEYLGVKFLIDTFGDGAFSLLHLKTFPVSYLKINPLLTADFESNARTRELIKSLVIMSQNLNISLVMQNIETIRQVKLADELGIHLLQGAYFGKPLSENEIEKAQLPQMV